MSNETENVNLEEEVLDLFESGKNYGQIQGYLKYAHDFNDKDARNFTSNILGKRSTSSKSWESTIEFMRTRDENMERKDVIKKMMELKGGTESSMGHAYSYETFAKEYAKQEVQAYKDSLEES